MKPLPAQAWPTARAKSRSILHVHRPFLSNDFYLWAYKSPILVHPLRSFAFSSTSIKSKAFHSLQFLFSGLGRKKKAAASERSHKNIETLFLHLLASFPASQHDMERIREESFRVPPAGGVRGFYVNEMPQLLSFYAPASLVKSTTKPFTRLSARAAKGGKTTWR